MITGNEFLFLYHLFSLLWFFSFINTILNILIIHLAIKGNFRINIQLVFYQIFWYYLLQLFFAMVITLNVLHILRVKILSCELLFTLNQFFRFCCQQALKCEIITRLVVHCTF